MYAHALAAAAGDDKAIIIKYLTARVPKDTRIAWAQKFATKEPGLNCKNKCELVIKVLDKP